MRCSALHKNSHVVIKGRQCQMSQSINLKQDHYQSKILESFSSDHHVMSPKTGKHSHIKVCLMVVINTFTDKR
ncbi:uncharacterized protein MELLADRAFT_88230 [Melampsora larici-populina 98AG31]|uniref:Uncharacterized protein n=1 Tax=Melampsora larici-populina (strain 98AG31 / pathotype 3-4-7) TaxID=747676 RepID=F4RR13_MELLP|nr:uncharacterized protein MELLADRAFT_88230 [Melampsora larici-populina 98AG31]EGG05130.1 hypothetical protein MELLADRAFT_88230 [Melampsora larici-populina 98AG31]